MLQSLHGRVTPAHLRFLLLSYLIGNVLAFLVLVPTGTPLDRRGQICGGDFLQFYVAGKIVADGQVRQLYSEEHFRDVQANITPITKTASQFYPLYPPTMALLFAPLGTLPYPVAVMVWWVLLLAAYVLAGRLLLAWRTPEHGLSVLDVCLGIAAFHPVVRSFWNAQLSPFWLLLFLGAHRLHEANRPVLAGMVLSLLALKPQLAACVGLWLLARRDGWTLLGSLLGGVGQLGLAALAFGPSIWRDYVTRSLDLYPRLGRMYDFSPEFQQSIQGIVVNVLGESWRGVGLTLQGVSAVLAALLLIRVVWLQGDHLRTQYAALILFLLLALPHLLIYDLVLLLIPVAWLLGRPGTERRVGWLLFASAAVAPLYNLLGFSLAPAAILLALMVLARRRWTS